MRALFRYFPVILCVALIGQSGRACTTVCVPGATERPIGKSYDWDLDHGLVVVNKRGVEKKALVLDPRLKGHSWTSDYGSVTFNQFGREFPLGGINEKGLVVEIMWLDDSVYPTVDKRPTVNELQWIQYQLDKYETVAKMIEDKDKVLVAKVHAPVHYMACDTTGSCATFEYLKGTDGKPEFKVHVTGKDLEYPTLTNDTYAASLKFLKEHVGFGGKKELPAGPDSLPRFARATNLAKNFDPKGEVGAVKYTFGILKDVAQGKRSVLNIVYEAKKGTVHFRTLRKPDVKTVKLSGFDFKCTDPLETKVIDFNEDGSGDVTEKFVDYKRELNRKIIETSLAGVDVPIPKEIVETFLVRYPEDQPCAKEKKK